MYEKDTKIIVKGEDAHSLYLLNHGVCDVYQDEEELLKIIYYYLY